MKTLRLTASDAEHIALSACILRQNGLVAIPTETVYGLAANALSDEAVRRIFRAKGRPQDNPLIIHIPDYSQLPEICPDIPVSAQILADIFWPGPLTMVLPKGDNIPYTVTAGLNTVAVRCPAHHGALAVLRASGLPLAAPSANRSGRPSPTCAQHVLDDLDGYIDAVLDGGSCLVGIESTVIDLTSNTPILLRPGGIEIERIIDVIGHVHTDECVFTQIEDSQTPRSPGMKHKHYAPRAPLFILRGEPLHAAAYAKSCEVKTAVLCFDEEAEFYYPLDVITYGSRDNATQLSSMLFDSLRRLDSLNAELLFARIPAGGGLFQAVANRLGKAAGFNYI